MSNLTINDSDSIALPISKRSYLLPIAALLVGAAWIAAMVAVVV